MEIDSAETRPDILDALFSDDAQLDALAQEAVRETLREHKRLGQSVVVWQDGKVVTLASEEIPADLTESLTDKAA